MIPLRLALRVKVRCRTVIALLDPVCLNREERIENTGAGWLGVINGEDGIAIDCRNDDGARGIQVVDDRGCGAASQRCDARARGRASRS